MKQLLKAVGGYYTGALQRAQRRKSPWNWVLLPIGFLCWFAVWAGLFAVVWMFHTLIFPNHAFHDFHDFWGNGASLAAIVPSFLMLSAIMPAAIGGGLIVANLMMWLIPPARRTFEAESREYPGTSFRAAMADLAKFTAWALAIGLPIALIAAACLRSLT